MLKQRFSDKIEVGCDEAGRGCLAGPVVAAAVLLPDYFNNKILNDSKQLSKKKREILEKIIKDEDRNLFFSDLHSDPWYECSAK
mgnify:CR=1 FL=1